MAQTLSDLERAELRLIEAEQAREKKRAQIRHAQDRWSARRSDRVAEHLVHQRYLERLGRELAPLDRTVEAASELREHARQNRQAAQNGLIQAEAELLAVEKNRQAWDSARKKQEEHRAELELEDVLQCGVKSGLAR